jgi:hypothetical protein
MLSSSLSKIESEWDVMVDTTITTHTDEKITETVVNSVTLCGIRMAGSQNWKNSTQSRDKNCKSSFLIYRITHRHGSRRSGGVPVLRFHPTFYVQIIIPMAIEEALSELCAAPCR